MPATIAESAVSMGLLRLYLVHYTKNSLMPNIHMQILYTDQRTSTHGISRICSNVFEGFGVLKMTAVFTHTITFFAFLFRRWY